MLRVEISETGATPHRVLRLFFQLFDPDWRFVYGNPAADPRRIRDESGYRFVAPPPLLVALPVGVTRCPVAPDAVAPSPFRSVDALSPA
jgi:hypothetical protein